MLCKLSEPSYIIAHFSTKQHFVVKSFFQLTANLFYESKMSLVSTSNKALSQIKYNNKLT